MLAESNGAKMNKKTKILTLLGIDTVFAILELVTGYAVHSLALIADAFHMFNDILSLLVALWAVNAAKSVSDSNYTYGMLRAEILGALMNGVFLLALCVTIVLEALQRLIDPPDITQPKLILIVGALGFLFNIVGLLLLHEHDHGHSHSHAKHQSVTSFLPQTVVRAEENRLLADSAEEMQYGSIGPNQTTSDHGHGTKKKENSMNMEGVFLHVLGDALGNIGVMVTALFIWQTDYSWRFYADPVVSLLIACIIFSSALPLCTRASRVLLQATPPTINADAVRRDVEMIEGVSDIHDLHIWQLNEDLVVGTMHVAINSLPSQFPDLAKAIQQCFKRHGIPSITIQPEFTTIGPNRECVSNGNLSSGGLSSLPRRSG